MRIQVTAEDIAMGIRCAVRLCPVARAFQRATGHTDITVSSVAVWHDTGLSLVLLCSLPYEAVRFVAAFDIGDSVCPFEFEGVLKEPLAPSAK